MSVHVPIYERCNLLEERCTALEDKLEDLHKLVAGPLKLVADEPLAKRIRAVLADFHQLVPNDDRSEMARYFRPVVEGILAELDR